MKELASGDQEQYEALKKQYMAQRSGTLGSKIIDDSRGLEETMKDEGREYE